VNPGRWSGQKIAAAFVAGVMFGVFSAVQVLPAGTSASAIGGTSVTPGITPTTAGEIDQAPGTGVVSGPTTKLPGESSGAVVEESGFECAAGRNGGVTDTGVTGTSIELATTVVRSGIGAAFLGEVQFAMEAVVNKVNRLGGICGRLLNVKYVDDGWDAQRGAQYLRNFIEEGVFAIPVGASSEGLRVVIDSGDIDEAGIPVVGTDGMIINQYTSPWVWPVAVATASSARIMARHAYALGARSFSIVFDKDYRFGAEAAEAFNNEVERLTRNPVPGYNEAHNCQQSFCGILAGQSSYSTDVSRFQAGDLVAMFVEPATALTWYATPNAPTASSGRMVWGAQPLFTRDFAEKCQRSCDGMWVWTGYRPPIEQYAQEPAVRTFVDDLKKTKPDADEYNAFSEGGYTGMLLLVEALKRVGPDLTRERLKAELDRMRFASGLTMQKLLHWSPADHFANFTMRSFEIQYKGTFGGWRAKSIFEDPTPERGVG
jgi:ABC-type branched-subunit amino acid transport system substrate-binding protein